MQRAEQIIIRRIGVEKIGAVFVVVDLRREGDIGRDNEEEKDFSGIPQEGRH